MRRLFAIFFTLSAWLCWGLDFRQLEPHGYVNDFAGVVDPGSKVALERYCAAVERATGAQIAIVTVPSLEGEPIEDFANNLFRHWGIGRKGNNEGALLLLATRDRRMRLEVGYGLEPVLPDGFAGGLLRQMRPALRRQEYGMALREAVAAIGARIAEAKGVTLEAASPRAGAKAKPEVPLPWPVLAGAGLFLVLLVLGAGGAALRGGGSGASDVLTAVLLSNLLGRGGGGFRRHGGGFGGYDSFDSFGGFGGGDSGGGGASGSW